MEALSTAMEIRDWFFGERCCFLSGTERSARLALKMGGLRWRTSCHAGVKASEPRVDLKSAFSCSWDFGEAILCLRMLGVLNCVYLLSTSAPSNTNSWFLMDPASWRRLWGCGVLEEGLRKGDEEGTNDFR